MTGLGRAKDDTRSGAEAVSASRREVAAVGDERSGLVGDWGDGDCVDEDSAVAYVGGRTSERERARVERHAAECAECRMVLSELARAEATGGAEVRGPVRGTHVGRYVVLSPVGAGAMGVVYAAFDPELERKVALKLLPPSAHDEGEARARRLRREAQAMARVSHENVVPVFDVGTWAGRVFVAMELVDGRPLSRWYREGPQPRPAAVLARLAEAGRGLEAAHRAGVVHRDFKPDNVLVSEARGARVTDFGLASLDDAPPGRPGGEGHESPGVVTRGLVGTPAYMAPEQLRGERADAQSDQFSFCVTAYEALYGERPFRGATVDALLAGIEAGAPTPPRGRGVPRRARSALARGLSARPERRFASMAALLEALRPGRSRALAWGALAAGAVLGLAALAARPLRGRPEPCADAGPHLAGVWDDNQKALVRHTLEGLGPVGRGAWPRVESSFDRRAREWAAARVHACRATYVHREQSEQALALRYACLDRRLAEMGALGAALARADEASAPRAVAAAEGLSRPDECADMPALLGPEPLPSEPDRAREGQAIARDLEACHAASALGRYQDAIDLGRAVAARARALGHRPLEAEALYEVAVAEAKLGDMTAAETLGIDAYRLAEAGRDDLMKVQTAAALTAIIGYAPARQRDALRWADLGFATLARVSANQTFEALLLSNMGNVLSSDAGRRDDAAAALGRALELGERAEMPTAFRSGVLIALGSLRSSQHRFDEGAGFFGRARDLLVAAYGADHPDVGVCENGLGAAYVETGDLARGREHLVRAHEVFVRSLGAAHLRTRNAHNNLCQALALEGATAPAVACQREAHRAAVDALGPAHQIAVDAALHLGALLAESHPAEALALLAPPIERLGSEGAGAELELGAALTAQGRARAAAGDRARAFAALRRAVEVLAALPEQTRELAEAEFALGCAAPVAFEARALVARARERLRALETRAVTPLALEMDEWLARPPPLTLPRRSPHAPPLAPPTHLP